MASFFDQVRACLAGERLPLDSGATKLLYYMLERPEGCDVTVTVDRFQGPGCDHRSGGGQRPIADRAADRVSRWRAPLPALRRRPGALPEAARWLAGVLRVWEIVGARVMPA